MSFKTGNNPSMQDFRKFNETFLILNKIQHMIPINWIALLDGKFIKEMEDPKYVPEGSKVFYKLPDIPGNDQNWHELGDDEKVDFQVGMEFQIVVPK